MLPEQCTLPLSLWRHVFTDSWSVRTPLCSVPECFLQRCPEELERLGRCRRPISLRHAATTSCWNWGWGWCHHCSHALVAWPTEESTVPASSRSFTNAARRSRGRGRPLTVVQPASGVSTPLHHRPSCLQNHARAPRTVRRTSCP